MNTPAPIGLILAPLVALSLSFGTVAVVPVSAQVGPAATSHGAFSSSEVCPTLQRNGTCPEFVELEVRDVIPLKEARSNAVVLVSKDQQVVLPIFVDESAALAIAFRLAHRTPPQPLSQDLLDNVLSRLGGQVTGVRIDDIHEHMLTTHVFIRQGTKNLGFDCRPSDGVAMALTRGARIFATKEVMAQAGITKKEIDHLRDRPPGSLDPHGPGVGGSGPGPAPGEEIKPAPGGKEIQL
jgi:bifunctional DNase/RNase